MMMYRFLPQLQAPWRGLSRLIVVEHMTSKTVDVECNAYQSTATSLAANCWNGSALHLNNLEFTRGCIILGESLLKMIGGKSDADTNFTTPTRSVQWSTIKSYFLPEISRPGRRR